MKKKLVLIMAVCLSLSLFGCGGQDASVEPVSTVSKVEKTDSEKKTEDIKTVEEPEALDEEETSKEVSNISVYDEMFTAFLNDELKVKIKEGVSLGYDDWDCVHSGEELTYSEFVEAACEKEDMDPANPEISVSILERANGNVLLLDFEGMGIEGPTDIYSHSYYVIAKRGNELLLTYNVNSWSRSDVTINASGIFQGGGSAGAGDHVFDMGYIDDDGEYQEIYFAEECFCGWIGMLFQYFENGFFSENTLELAGKMDEMEGPSEDVVCFYRINNSLYGEFDAEDSETVNALKEAAALEGLNIADYEEMQKVISEYAMSVGFLESDLSNGPMEWIKIKENK